MSKGLSLHIGLNSVDPNHYSGWSGPLVACEADAIDMESICKAAGFNSNTLLTQNGTRSAVINAIQSAAGALTAGDIFALSYSGHGGQLPDLTGDEADLQDETWCLYDGELVDDEIYALLGKIPQGVRVLVFSDSCHSGTVVKKAHYLMKSPRSLVDNIGGGYKAMPDEIALRVYLKNKAFYDKILSDPALKNAQESVNASVILISGCLDSQLSADGAFNGLFTGTLKRVWSNGGFRGSYRDFHKTILLRMPPDQSPDFYTVGQQSAAFEAQKPFTV
jgi:metacaspase-1